MNLFTRISAKDVSFHSEEKDLDCLLKKYLTPYSKESILNMMINYQSRDHFYSQNPNILKLINYNLFLTNKISNFRIRNLFYCYNNPVLLTRANALLIETYVLTSKDQFGTEEITYDKLLELLLLINEEDSKSELGLKPNQSLTTDILEKLVQSIIRSFNLIECAKLRIPDLNRNYDLITQLLQTEEGIECDKLFTKISNIDILRYISIGYVFYCLLWTNFTDNNFSNIINLDSLFDGITSDELKLKKLMQDVLDKLCGTTTTENINYKLYDTSYIWNHNIRKLSENKYQVIDIGLFVSNFIKNNFLTFESPFLNCPEKKEHDKNLYLRCVALSKVFEKQANDIFHSLKNVSYLDNHYTNGEEISDCVFNINDSLFFVECKSGFLPVTKFAKGSEIDILKEIFKKFGGKYTPKPPKGSGSKKEENKRKGLLQIIDNFIMLDNWDESLYNKKEVNIIKTAQKVFGIVFVEETAISVPALNKLIYSYNQEKIKELSSKHFFAPIFIHINDMHKILHSETNLNFPDVLESYLEALSKDYLGSFNDFLIDYCGNPIEVNDAEHSLLVKEMMNKVYTGAGLHKPNL